MPVILTLGTLTLLGFLILYGRVRGSTTPYEQALTLSTLANFSFYIVPAVGLLSITFALANSWKIVWMLLIAPLSVWYWFWGIRKWRDGMGGSLAAYIHALQADTLSGRLDELASQIHGPLPATNIDFYPLITWLYEDTAKWVPQPPTSIFDVHEHNHYRAQIRDWMKRPSATTPEMDAVFVQTASLAFKPLAEAFPATYGRPFLTTAPEHSPEFPSLVASLVGAFTNPRATTLRLFPDLLDRLSFNIKRLDELKTQPNISTQALAHSLLEGTKLPDLFQQRVSYEIRNDLWYESAHIVAGTGGFKTQLLGSFIADQLKKTPRPGFMVLDSQGGFLHDLRNTLKGQLPLLYVDLEHEEIELNPFDIDIGNQFESRGRAIIALSNMFTFLFETGDAALSTKMNVLFSKVLDLLLFAFPEAEHRIATFADLAAFMRADRPQDLFINSIQALPVADRGWFSKTNLDSYKDTRQQIGYRLDSLLNDPFIKRMLSAPRTNFDVTELLEGGTILVNTNKDLHKQNASFVGKLFIGLAEQAMTRRVPVPQGDPYPSFLVIDEAQEYFKGSTDTLAEFIVQARKRRFGLIVAHHYYSQAPALLQTALKSCSIQLASKINQDDLLLLRSVLNTSEALLRAQKPEAARQSRYADYALLTPDLSEAMSVRLNYGNWDAFNPASLGTSHRSSTGARPGPQPGASSTPPPPPPPAGDVEGQYDLIFEEIISPAKMRAGGEHMVQIPSHGKVKIQIRSGSRYGTRIRLQGYGARKPDGTCGDIWVVLKQHPDTVDPNESMDTGAQPWP